MHIEHWAHLPAGEQLKEAIERELANVLPTIFGQHWLSIGELSQQLQGALSPIQHRINMDDHRHPACGLVAQADELPFAEASIDLILLTLTLDFHEHPHQVLREAARALMPDGYLIVIGMNPWGLWGMRHRLRRWWQAITMHKKTSFKMHPISRRRVRDWLELLGFDVKQQTKLLSSRRVLRRILRLGIWHMLRRGTLPATNMLYVMVAQKRTSVLTPIRLRWVQKTRLLPHRLPEPVARHQCQSEGNS